MHDKKRAIIIVRINLLLDKKNALAEYGTSSSSETINTSHHKHTMPLRCPGKRSSGVP